MDKGHMDWGYTPSNANVSASTANSGKSQTAEEKKDVGRAEIVFV